MGLFDIPKPRITGKEFDKVLDNLRSKGFQTHHIDKVRTIFRGDLDKDAGSSEAGINHSEVQSTFEWMRGHRSEHGLSDHHIDTLEKEMNEKMKT